MSGCVSPHTPCTKSDSTWCTGGGAVMGTGRWVGRMRTHIPAEWMVLCRGVDLRAVAHVLLERSFAHLFLKWVALVLRSRSWYRFHSAVRPRWAGTVFCSQALCAGQDSVSWQIPSKSTCC